ncbi:MAG TPA: RidA family protein [Paludibacteraceae bacterium]|nr:RidA family protein [Paludibacteraceae bacterium]HOL00893.1 RidA family protein [Paludibacteraceae bacterium]HPC26260.1 RidA family protein [Paludibacteraceae bacterium]HPO67780.1 RidA family protein [Paludibacteraceae bacterium]
MKKIINTHNAPAAIGPYNQAIEINNMLFISGQIPISPKEGKIVSLTILEQTEQIFSNIEAILKFAGYSFENVVKTTVFLTDINHFAAMNEVYKKYFTNNCPARSTVAVKALPHGALVEIETIAIK